MSDLFKEVSVNGVTLKVYFDTHVKNPREDTDYTSKMISFHSNYQLGDKHSFKTPEEFLCDLCYDLGLSYHRYSDFIEDLVNRIEKSGKVIMLPIYAYEHGAITIKTGSFSCPWDSGQVGWIYEIKESIRKEWKVKKVSKKLEEMVVNRMKSEVAIYDQWLQGDVYGFVLKNEESGETDSCWGFWGTDWKENGMFGEMNISEELKAELMEQLN